MVLDFPPITSSQPPTPSLASQASRTGLPTGPSALICPCDKNFPVPSLVPHLQVLDLEYSFLFFHVANSSSFRIQFQLSLDVGNHPFATPIKISFVSAINEHNTWFNNCPFICLSPQTVGILRAWPIHFIFFIELIAICKFVFKSLWIYFLSEPPTTEVKNYVCLVHCCVSRAWHSDWHTAGDQ